MANTTPCNGSARSERVNSRKRNQRTSSPQRKKARPLSSSSRSSQSSRGSPTRLSTKGHTSESSHSRRRRKRREKAHYGGGEGDVLDGRYRILRKIGEGTFARVYRCEQTSQGNNELVAVKIVRAGAKEKDGAEQELAILEDLQKHDPEGKKHCVRVLRTFLLDKEGSDVPHTCIVFPIYGPSLYWVLEKTKFRGFDWEMVRSFTLQLIECVAHIHSREVIHGDIKPENILLEDTRLFADHTPVSSKIVIIDFGSSQYDYKRIRSTVGTRHYRSPEALLGLGYALPSDMWSIGCLLPELLTGECIFQTHDTVEHIAMMEHVLRKYIPFSMIEASDMRDDFDSEGRIRWPTRDTSPSDERYIAELPYLRHRCTPRHGPHANDSSMWELVKSLLRYNPAKRITAADALQHPFCATAVPDM